jgi:hypothetical protein
LANDNGVAKISTSLRHRITTKLQRRSRGSSGRSSSTCVQPIEPIERSSTTERFFASLVSGPRTRATRQTLRRSPETRSGNG